MTEQKYELSRLSVWVCGTYIVHHHNGTTTIDQLMFASINVRIFAKQTSSLLLMFADFCHEE